MQLNMAKKNFDNQSVISSLKGADRVRKRPAVIFGSDGLEGCEHSFFEILSNSIDEAREGFGKVINVTFMSDHTITVEDFGRGVPLDWNEKEGRYNWELVYCELYAGGKYNNSESAVYEFSLGTNGLGACATQCASEFMDVVAYTDGVKYSISFKKGEPAPVLPPRSGEYTSSSRPDDGRWPIYDAPFGEGHRQLIYLRNDLLAIRAHVACPDIRLRHGHVRGGKARGKDIHLLCIATGGCGEQRRADSGRSAIRGTRRHGLPSPDARSGPPLIPSRGIYSEEDKAARGPS